MQQIRINRTSALDKVLSSLKERYPLLSEAEIIKMALSNQYHQEIKEDPTERFTNEEWKKKFQLIDEIRDRISPEEGEALDEVIDKAVREVRAEKRYEQKA